jgi:hypothetical protein
VNRSKPSTAGSASSRKAINHRFGPKPKRRLANSQRIDLDDAFAEMLDKVTARDADRWTRKAR